MILVNNCINEYKCKIKSKFLKNVSKLIIYNKNRNTWIKIVYDRSLDKAYIFILSNFGCSKMLENELTFVWEMLQNVGCMQIITKSISILF